MPYIVVVNHKSKGAIRIQTDVAHKENAIAQAKMRNPEPGYDWEGATVEERPAELDAAEKNSHRGGRRCYRSMLSPRRKDEGFIRNTGTRWRTHIRQGPAGVSCDAARFRPLENTQSHRYPANEVARQLHGVGGDLLFPTLRHPGGGLFAPPTCAAAAAAFFCASIIVFMGSKNSANSWESLLPFFTKRRV